MSLTHHIRRKVLASTIAVLTGTAAMAAADSHTLTGRVLGTTPSVDYATGTATTFINTPECAFDGNLNTYYASYTRSFTWVGLELDQPHVITRVGISPRNDGVGPERVKLGVFQGANLEDFSDAVPIAMCTSSGTIGQMTWLTVDCTRAFRYVRYVGPHSARCNVAEVVFEGYEAEGSDSRFFRPSNLPLVIVNTPGMEWFTSEKKHPMEGSTVMIVDADGNLNTEATAQIRGRGNASWTFPKKPFRIKFDKKQQPLDAPAKAKKWTMIANYGDKSLMRNMLGFEFSRRLGMDYTPYCQPVDLIFNGEYQGTYCLCDQITINPGRVDITEMSLEDTDEETITGGYLFEIDAYASDEETYKWFATQRGHYIPSTIHSPDSCTKEQYIYLRDRFSAVEYSVLNEDPDDPDRSYKNLLDLDSFLRYFIVNELAGNTDTFWSTYMWLERGEPRFKVGPVWDMELGFNNDNRTYPVNNKSDFVCFYGSWARGAYNMVERIIKFDPSARYRLQQLWSHARKYLDFTTGNLVDLVADYQSMLNESQKLNFVRWPILNQTVHQNPIAYGSYSSEVSAVRSYLAQRLNRLDSLIGIVDVEESDALPSVAADTAAKWLGAVTYGGFVTADDLTVNIFTPEGRPVASSATGFVALPSGFYIVCSGGVALKIAVR